MYVQRSGENARGLHAMRVLEGKTDFTLQSLLDAAFDSYLTGFEELIAALVRSYDQAAASDPLRAELAEQVGMLRDWDLRWDDLATVGRQVKPRSSSSNANAP